MHVKYYTIILSLGWCIYFRWIIALNNYAQTVVWVLYVVHERSKIYYIFNRSLYVFLLINFFCE